MENEREKPTMKSASEFHWCIRVSKISDFRTERCKELERDEYQRRRAQMISGHDQGCLWRRVRRRPKTDMDKEQFEDNLLVNTLSHKKNWPKPDFHMQDFELPS